MGAPPFYGRPQNQSNTLQFRPDSFMGGQTMNALPRNVLYDPTTGPGTGRTAQRLAGSWGGVNGWYELQDRRNPAFANPRGIFGMGGSADEKSRIMTNQGMMFNPHVGGYVPDTLYNRTTGYRKPYMDDGGQEQMPDGGEPKPPSLTEPQQRWANKAQEKMSGVGALGKIGEKMASINPAMGQLGWLSKIAGAASNVMGGAPTFGQNPYSGTREQNIANARAAGEFDKVRAAYNEANKGGSLRMDEAGNITQDPVALAKIKEDERRLNRGETLDTQKRGGITFRNLTSPYGSGSSRLVKGKVDLMSKTPSTVRDDFGRIIPMNQYLERKRYVQGTKGMA